MREKDADETAINQMASTRGYDSGNTETNDVERVAPIGEALRLLRVLNDRKATDLAAELGISRSYVSDIENGRKEPSTDVIRRYAEVFGVPVSSIWFFHERLNDNTALPALEKLKGVVARKILNLLRLIEQKADI